MEKSFLGTFLDNLIGNLLGNPQPTHVQQAFTNVAHFPDFYLT
jgi:hypothetical protein